MRQRPSQHATNVAYYWRNRQRESQRVKARQAATVALLRDLRKGPCAVCGMIFEPHQMDFDHRIPEDKAFRVTAGRAMLMSRARLFTEIDKCDVVCANCHRLRTHAAHAEHGKRDATPGSSTSFAMCLAQIAGGDSLPLRWTSIIAIR